MSSHFPRGEHDSRPIRRSHPARRRGLVPAALLTTGLFAGASVLAATGAQAAVLTPLPAAEAPSTGAADPAGSAATVPFDPALGAEGPVARAQPVSNDEAEVFRDTHGFGLGASAHVTTPDLAVMGVTWTGDPDEDPATEYRLKVGGQWQDWQPALADAGDGPDPGTKEAEGARRGTEPVVIAEAEEVEVRTTNTAAEVDDTQVEIYSSTPTTADTTITGGPAGAAPPEEPVEEPTESAAETAPTEKPSEAPADEAPADEAPAESTEPDEPTESAEEPSEAPADSTEPSEEPNEAPAESPAPAEESPEETENPGFGGTSVENSTYTGGAGVTTTGSVPHLGTVTLRHEWGADADLVNWGDLDRFDRVDAVVVHHTAGASNYSASQAPSIIRGIQRYHTEGLGWSDIGYNMLVDKYGNVYEGRVGSRPGGGERMVQGAHAGGFNQNTFGVAVLGTWNNSTPTGALPALERVVGWQAKRWAFDPTDTVSMISGNSTKYSEGQRVTLDRVMGHRDVSATECPGWGLYTRLDSIATNAERKYGLDHDLIGGIRDTWAKIDGLSVLGQPKMTERGGLKDGGAYQHFEKGSIHWNRTTKGHYTTGAFRNEWKNQGWERGVLGYPRTDPTGGLVDGGKYQHYQGGSIHWSKATGAHTTRDGMRDKWKETGWERGYLGYPRMSERGGLRNGGAYQHFQGGSIHWSPAHGAHTTRGTFRDRWKALGWESGRLGYPTSDQFRYKGELRQRFEGGVLRLVNGQVRVVWR
ncbi:N-acetylmuramoyl-L-alanine amidase [Brevibacterium litoralis]|uniref:N-acetylmuramoyl-L-alanine amidase n=1 Tax=Brevibacterium litoralis TaxID=3138935 RepID=UPI0032ECA6E3